MTLPRQRGLTEQAATTAVDQACRILRLPTIRSQFPDLAETASREQMSYLGFLAELLLAECDDRARRRSERRIKAAGFPRDKSLRKFDFEANPNIDAAMIHTLAKCEWIKKGLPLCLIGDSGTGKSHLLIALGTEAAMAGYRVKYVLATKLVNELVEAADEKQLTKTIARYGRVDLLCIDELGYRLGGGPRVLPTAGEDEMMHGTLRFPGTVENLAVALVSEEFIGQGTGYPVLPQPLVRGA
ncbi:ATP-binding protein [Streptomyces griseoloalbus]|uniref:ATP-binding protein n=1 Tax=Streptomyces griseoloalbus TaxID=67303 RepID=A0ABV3E5I8_9ACTN